MPLTESDELIGVREAARIAGVHENTIRNWTKAGLLESAQRTTSRGKRTYRKFSRLTVERLAAMDLPEPPPEDRVVAYQRGYADGWRDAHSALRGSVIREFDRLRRPENGS